MKASRVEQFITEELIESMVKNGECFEWKGRGWAPIKFLKFNNDGTEVEFRGLRFLDRKNPYIGDIRLFSNQRCAILDEPAVVRKMTESELDDYRKVILQ